MSKITFLRSFGKAGAGGGGGGGVSNPDAIDLIDGEMIRFNQGTGKMEPSGDINTDTEVDFGTKIGKFGVGSIQLGDNLKMSASGENTTFTNLADQEFFNPVWVSQVENIAEARKTVGPLEELTQEVSKADILINPSWVSNPLVDWRVVSLTFETDTTITNAEFSVQRGGGAFWRAQLGTLTANVEKTIDLALAPNTFVDAFTGGNTYVVSVTSVDGDVRLKGSIANLLPFFKVGYYEFEDREILDDHSTTFGRIEQRMSLRTDNPAEYIISTGILRLEAGQTTVNSNSSITTVLQNATNGAGDVFLTGLELDFTQSLTFVRFTINAIDGEREFTANVGAGVLVVPLPKPLRLQPSEVFTFEVDLTNAIGIDKRMDGELIPGPTFNIYYQIEVEDVKIRDLDPDLRTQRRTFPVGYEQQGYQAQVGGGVKETQGWTDESTGAAVFNPQIDPTDNIITLTSRDNTAGGLTLMTKPISGLDFQDLFDFGGQISFRVRSLAESGGVSAAGGLGFSAASDPGYKGGTRGRWLIQFGINGSGFQTFTPQGGTEVVTATSLGYIEIILVIPAGSMNTDIYVNGIFNQTYDFATQNSNIDYDDSYVFGSGSTSASGRNANLRITELTTFTGSPVLPFGKVVIESNIVAALPYGVFRDWVAVVDDVDVEFGSSSQTQLSNYGSLTLTRVGDEVTFNGQDEMTIVGPGSIAIAQVNVDPDSPDKRYQVSFQGAASPTVSVFSTSDVALPAFQRLERIALLEVIASNSEDVTLNPDQVTNDTIQLVAQRIQVFPVTPVKDGVLTKEDKVILDNLAANVPFEAIKQTASFLAGNGLRYLVDTSGGAVTVTIDATVNTFWIGDYNNTWTNTNTVSVVVGVDTIVLNMANRNEVFMFTRQGTEFRVYDGSGLFKAAGNI